MWVIRNSHGLSNAQIAGVKTLSSEVYDQERMLLIFYLH